MKLVKLTCDNCNGQLEIDLDHIQAYCPYCGQKLLIDSNNIDAIIAERDKAGSGKN
jgi:DNA-directed RNA polymerase subunit RPC12/RpoP